VSGYTFPHFSTDLLQTWREYSMGLTREVGYVFYVCTHHVCMLSARMCVFAYFWMDYLKICREHDTMIHHKLYPWAMYFSCSSTTRSFVSSRVKHLLIFRRILSKQLLWVTTIYVGYILSMFHAPRACV
jgi:hypothetical protein